MILALLGGVIHLGRVSNKEVKKKEDAAKESAERELEKIKKFYGDHNFCQPPTNEGGDTTIHPK
jgi:hypothetical protein